MSERRPSRLNLEPELFIDPRYHALVDKVGRNAATGMVVNFWMLAQGYYKQHRHVPKDLFLLGGYGPLLEVGLAKEEEDGVRAAGEAEQFSWLRSKQASGGKGGKKSGETRRKQREAKRSESKQDEANASNAKEIEPSPSSSEGGGEEGAAASRQPSSSPSAPPPAECAQEFSAPFVFSPTDPADTAALDPGGSPPDFRALWNAHCGTLPRCAIMSESRKTKWRARWRENPRQEYWVQSIERLAHSRFCNGESASGWRATPDFMLKPDTHVKAREGQYDSSPGARRRTNAELVSESNQELMAKNERGEL